MTLKKLPLHFLLILSLVLGSLSSFAQPSATVDMITDKESYCAGETVTISDNFSTGVDGVFGNLFYYDINSDEAFPIALTSDGQNTFVFSDDFLELPLDGLWPGVFFIEFAGYILDPLDNEQISEFVYPNDNDELGYLEFLVDTLINDVEDRIYVGPTVVCEGEEVEFYFQGTLGHITNSWDFGDGSDIDTNEIWFPLERSSFHSYDSVGTYQVVFEEINACGNTELTFDIQVFDPDSMELDVSIVQEAMANENGSYVPVSGYCPDDIVALYPSITGILEVIDTAYYIFDWYIPSEDEWIMDTREPEFSFDEAGEYEVELHLESKSCGSTYIHKDTVKVGDVAVDEEAVTVIVENDTICPGDHTIFNVQLPNSYTYTLEFGDDSVLSEINTAIVLYEYASGIHTYKVTAQNSCGNSMLVDEGQIDVGAGDGNAPELDLEIFFSPFLYDGDINAHVNEDVEMFLSGQYESVTWDFGDGNTSTDFETIVEEDYIGVTTKHQYSAAGFYAVKVTVTDACGLSSTITFDDPFSEMILIDNPASIKELKNAGNIGRIAKVAPNPSNGQFQIELFDNKDKYNIQVYNMLGAEVPAQITRHHDKVSVSMQETIPGIYVLQLSNQSAQYQSLITIN